MPVKINMCESCAEKLRDVLRWPGEARMAREVQRVLRLCPTCKPQALRVAFARALTKHRIPPFK